MRVERNFEDIAIKPSLKNLSLVLRHEELWPAGFEWSYGDCHYCAMGLASQLWDSDVSYPSSSMMVASFGMALHDSQRIFGGNNPLADFGVTHYDYITPEMVADKIDEYLGTK